jgi:osmotically-inducible protein OsmY
VSICALLLLPLLGACDSSDSGKTVGQKLDNVVARTEQVAADVKDAAKTSADSAGAAVLDGAERAQTAARQTADNVAMESQDLVISASVAAGLLKDPDLSMVKIDVDSKRGTVSLYGPAPSEEARLRATVIARGVKGVVDVDNKLTVKTS